MIQSARVRWTGSGFVALLRHELRLAVRAVRGGQTLPAQLIMLVLLAVPLVAGVLGAIALRHGQQHGNSAAVPPLGLVTAVIGTTFVLMLSRALTQVLRSFYHRADLDLLLSAPIPVARVLAAKAVGIYIIVALPYLLLSLPFFVTMAVLGQPGWLGAVVMLGVAAMLSTSLALVLADGLARRFGVRRGRIAVQIAVGGLAGVVFLLAQSASFAPRYSRWLYRHVAAPPLPPFDWPARAALGQPLLLLLFVALGCVVAWAAAERASQSFAEPGERLVPDAAAPTSATLTFRHGWRRALLSKELRLLIRDPELLSQVLLRLVYLLPICGLLLTSEFGGLQLPRLAAAAVLFLAMLASSLAWLIVCAEDAPELLASAPVGAGAIGGVKLLAACLPSLTVLAVVALWLLPAGTAAAGATLVCGLPAILAAAQTQSWFGKRKPRTAFRYRQSGSALLAIAESLMAAAWSGSALLAARGAATALPAIAASSGLVVLAYLLRPPGARAPVALPMNVR